MSRNNQVIRFGFVDEMTDLCSWFAKSNMEGNGTAFFEPHGFVKLHFTFLGGRRLYVRPKFDTGRVWVWTFQNHKQL